jgi:hypothetical protein
MENFIKALSDQIVREDAKALKRQMQMSNPNFFLGEPLQECRSPEFLSEMRRAIQILRSAQTAIDVLKKSDVYDDMTVTAEKFALDDSRVCQLQIKVTTDVYDFTDHVADYS